MYRYTACMEFGGGGGGVITGALAYYNSSFGVAKGLKAAEDSCGEGSSAPTKEALAAGGTGMFVTPGCQISYSYMDHTGCHQLNRVL